MSDLISRSELYMNNLIRRKDVLELFSTNDCSDKMIGLYERILDIPTAYDVEKVVAELEERRAKNDCRVCRHFQNGKDECMEDCTDALIDDLLDIVRKGGINETD